MVGGRVIGVARGKDGTLLHVRGSGSEGNDTCSVRCVERRCDTGRAVAVSVGDQVWWQGRCVYWTPAGVESDGDVKGCGVRWDIAMPKVGYSH